MSKGDSGLFRNTIGSNKLSENIIGSPISGVDYNYAESWSVKQVEVVLSVNNAHSVSAHGEVNSVLQNYKDGKMVSERYYDGKGNAYLDIDYTDHGNPKTHPNVPHEHAIVLDEHDNIKRGKDKVIQK